MLKSPHGRCWVCLVFRCIGSYREPWCWVPWESYFELGFSYFSGAWVDLFLNVVCKLCNSSEDVNLQL
jgi:hypothetical protein